MSIKVWKESDCVPIRVWTDEVEETARRQLYNLSTIPFICSHGIAVMPDVHAGKGSTVGTVIATQGAVIPAAVGVDIGCGMNALRLPIRIDDIVDDLPVIREAIERLIPVGTGGCHQKNAPAMEKLNAEQHISIIDAVFGGDANAFYSKATSQLGTLGSGNHFIELSVDGMGYVWVVLHSGSRGVGNMIGQHYIKVAKAEMKRWFINLPDPDLAYLIRDTEAFSRYMVAVMWAQEYAALNRRYMMSAVHQALRDRLCKGLYPHLHEVNLTDMISCHHNYVSIEHHFDKDLYVTRKGAIRARLGDKGIIPGSMGDATYITEGLGNVESYCSASHGAGRKMSRTKARQTFDLEQLKAQTHGVECRKDIAVIDEIPGAYKDIHKVMENQADLVRSLHILTQVICIKGS